MVPALGIALPVINSQDCMFVPRGAAGRDYCAPAALVYLVGHSPGAFDAVKRAQAGS